VRIGISTGGVAPRVGKIIKEALQRVLDAKFVRFVDCLATQKRRNRSRLAGDGAARRRAIIGATSGFELKAEASYPQWFEEELAALDPRAAE
jgi:siroheme synthase (precorrin-2 oxidase/ferrochelatase)